MSASATTTALLERDAELAELDAALDRARGGHGTVVLVAGEPGIGKSTLVAAWTQRLAPTDTRVMIGWCDDFLTGRTLGPLHDVARSVGGTLADAVARADTGAVLDAVLDVLDDPLRPVVLVLEDVHWADEATLDVIRYVGRRIEDVPAVLVLTFRDDEVDAEQPLTGVLAALAGSPVTRLGPGPLSEAAVAAIVGGDDREGLDPHEVAVVTGGNPFFVSEVVRTRDRQVPVSVTDAVLARVRNLPAAPRRALQQLSVMPGSVPRDLAAAVVGDEALLAPAERRGLLVGTVDTVRFRHELARRAVEGALTTMERVAAHRRVLDVLLAVDHPDAFPVLHHAVAAGAADVVAERGPAAATEAFRAGAFRQAAALQVQVLAHADRLPAAVHARLLEQHAWALYNVHRFDEASAAARAAVDLHAQLDDPAGLVRALLTRSRMDYMANEPWAARQSMQRATTLAEAIDDAELAAEVLVARAMLLLLVDQVEQAAALVDGALQAAIDVGRPDLAVLARNYRGMVRIAQGESDEGLVDLYEAVVEGREVGALEPTARAYTNLVEELVRTGQWDEALPVIDEAVAFYDDHDFVAHRYNTTCHRGLILLFRGQWDAAHELFQQLQASGSQPGVLEVMALNGLARLAIRRGDPDAEELVERAWTMALASDAAQYVTMVASARVEWAWLNDRRELIPETVAQALLPAASPQHRAMLLRQVQLSDIDLDLDVDPDEFWGPQRSGLRGDWRAAAEGWAAVGASYTSALELASSGEPAPMLEALATFDELGAAPAARWVRQRLRDLGVRSIPRGPAASTRQNPAGLTDRQVEVLELLREGLTNVEIADRLVVSVRTVDHHVSAILQRLGVANRHQAAAAAADLQVP